MIPFGHNNSPEPDSYAYVCYRLEDMRPGRS